MAMRLGENIANKQTMNSAAITKTQQSLETQNSLLAQYAEVRWQMSALEAKLKEIESLAIEEAMNVMNANNSNSHIIFNDQRTQITLQFRTTKPKVEDNADLETLAELIKLEEQKAAQANGTQIQQLKLAMASIEAVLSELTITADGANLKAEYDSLIQQLTDKKPILAVKLK